VDFDLTAGQRSRLDVIDEVVAACGGEERAASVARAGDYDAELDEKLGAAALAGATTLDRVLVAEGLARRGLAVACGLGTVLSATEPGVGTSGCMAVTTAERTGPVRWGAQADCLIVLDGEQARVLDASEFVAEPVPSSFGYPYARVQPTGVGRALATGAGTRLRSHWRLALAAEISGSAAGGLAVVTTHLRSRRQFGKPLSSFQALRHRFAEAAVSAQATQWLVREAAHAEDDRRITLAAHYAARTAAALAPELVHLCGARGFSREFGLHVFAMRLDGLRLELGGADRLATELVRGREDGRVSGMMQP
jgi:alkylation response protein AidB-like acyl-CoA dehydrogenase